MHNGSYLFGCMYSHCYSAYTYAHELPKRIKDYLAVALLTEHFDIVADHVGFPLGSTIDCNVYPLEADTQVEDARPQRKLHSLW